jgi:F0F1-type ATP synthase membrane subunit a
MPISLIVIIETIRLFTRPITLAIRLTVNIIAEHLLTSLIGSAGQTRNITMLSIILNYTYLQMLLIILEIVVAFIQFYVFTILTR